MFKGKQFWMGFAIGVIALILLNYVNPMGIMCSVNNATGKVTGN
jgi:hypothetical protein